jgi:hypothetical protein
MKTNFRMNFSHHEKAIRKSIDDFKHTAIKQVADDMLNPNRLIGGWLKISFDKAGYHPPF